MITILTILAWLLWMAVLHQPGWGQARLIVEATVWGLFSLMLLAAPIGVGVAASIQFWTGRK